MAFLQTTVNVNLHRLKRFQSALDADLRKSANGPVREAFNQWKIRYAAFLRRRYERFSRGAGNWPKLAASTLEYKKRNRLLMWILRATDTLYRALEPIASSKPGYVNQDIEFGIRVGFGGGMKYPHSTEGSVTIAQVASYHQKGGRHLPQRKIIVPPDTETVGLMREDMQKALRTMAREANG